MIDRREFLGGLGSLLAAPAIVPVKAVDFDLCVAKMQQLKRWKLDFYMQWEELACDVGDLHV